jgi:hypothetical protein
VIFITLASWASATQTHIPGDELTPDSYHYFCGNENDSIVVHAPENALTNIYWTFESTGDLTWDLDSIIITVDDMGLWSFSSQETGSFPFSVYIISALPYEPGNFADENICTFSFSRILDAQNTEENSSYLWSTQETTQTISVDAPGIYTVTVTNVCGEGVFSKTITQGNPNAPDLGPDQEFCLGGTTTLDPQSTNVTSTLWSTGSTDPQLVIGESGSYWVHVEDANGCYVEFDTVTWKNNIVWTSILPGNADSICIYKETSLNVWTLIGTVGTTTTNFLDITSAPQEQSYSYRLAIVDTCGNESDMSSYHTTITLLSTYDSGTNTYGFTWSPYYGLTVADYSLYGIDASNVVHFVGSVPGNQFFFNYLNPDLTYIKYFVGFETPNCDGTKANVIVKSNWIQSVITDIEEKVTISFSVYPNPANDQLNLTIEKEIFDVQIFNTLGQAILTESNTKVLNINNLSSGMYIISVSANGLNTNQRFVKQ